MAAKIQSFFYLQKKNLKKCNFCPEKQPTSRGIGQDKAKNDIGHKNRWKFGSVAKNIYLCAAENLNGTFINCHSEPREESQKRI
ncbi:MAG: hypothetical protein J6W69_07180 [Bacteroidales bacterium]|nr:hypothetical protein [Bacteroidales bacterium]